MSETRAIIAAGAQLRAAGEPYLIATVVRVRGSSYRRPGARMLLTPERWIAGSVSGGCLEGDVVKKGWWRTRDARAVLVTYDSTAHDEIRWGFGLGCDGVVDVLLERAPDEGSTAIDALRFFERCMRAQERGVLATVFHSDSAETPVGSRLALSADGAIVADPIAPAARERIEAQARVTFVAGASEVRSFGDMEVLFEIVLPPPRLFVFGAGHDAVPVVQIARSVGWDTVVCEDHARFATRERFTMADEILAADAAALAARVDASDRPLGIIMGHNYEQDRAHLALLLGTRARYIGVLGPRRRTDKMLSELGPAALADPRVHAPVGLDLGAETPAEIALSMIAEVQATLAHATATSLRERRVPIHAAVPVAG